MSKQTKWLVVIIVILMVAFLSLGLYHANQASQLDDQALTIKTANKTIHLTIEDILSFDKVEFEANVKSTGNDPVLTNFGGVLLADVLAFHQITLSGSETVVFKAIDGYHTNVSGLEVLQPDNVYIVYERENQRTKSRAEGGSGPLEIVIALDAFSQRWNKYLIEIEIKP